MRIEARRRQKEEDRRKKHELSVGYFGDGDTGKNYVIDKTGTKIEMSGTQGKVSCGLRKMSCGLRKISCGLRKMSCGLRKMSCRLRKVSCGLRKVSCDLRKMSLEMIMRKPEGFTGNLSSVCFFFPFCHTSMRFSSFILSLQVNLKTQA